jgi:hypothetical protein
MKLYWLPVMQVMYKVVLVFILGQILSSILWRKSISREAIPTAQAEEVYKLHR